MLRPRINESKTSLAIFKLPLTDNGAVMLHCSIIKSPIKI